MREARRSELDPCLAWVRRAHKAAAKSARFSVHFTQMYSFPVYGVFTTGQRTWGGPRADAGFADSTTTPQQAIEHAEAVGDDLNIIPETFRQAGRLPRRRSTTLQPSGLIEGRFAHGRQSRQWTKHTGNYGLPLPAWETRGRPESCSSVESADSIDFALQAPRFVGSISGQREAKEYQGGGASWSPDIDMEDEMQTNRMPHVLNRTFGHAKHSTKQRYSASQMVIDSGKQRQLRRSRATIPARQSRGPDPEELHARLSSLPFPQPTYDGSGAML